LQVASEYQRFGKKKEGRTPGAGWGVLPNFLSGYQGGAAWQGAFLASLTTETVGGYQGGASWLGAFLASRLDSDSTRKSAVGSAQIYKFHLIVKIRTN
jgi:hypothetical protein